MGSDAACAYKVQVFGMKERGGEMEKPLLTVVVPVYNVEKYIEKCIYSLQTQSYKNLEIICVDDASPDRSVEILQRLAASDPRIRIVHHEKNQGLFRARLTGISHAKGKVIAFVDSDDFVSSDWFRPLIKVMVNNGADMVLGNTVNVDEAGKKTYFNHYRSFNLNHKPLEGDALLRCFFEQKGECFIWHTVWNKVYSRELIARSFPYLDKLQERLVMGEDIIFSTVFYAMANKLCFCDNDCYFYYRHSQASTSIHHSRERLYGYVKDICNVFAFAENFLKQCGRLREVERDFRLFKEKYFRIWSGNIRAAGYEKDKEIVQCLLQGFCEEELSAPGENEFYFYDQSTEWDEKFEELRFKIQQDEVSTVSFDIFDTLIVRPFWTPDDLFYFVAEKVDRIIPEEETFVAMRKEAEDKCRLFVRTLNPGTEDVTLGEIYAFMARLFGFTEKETETLMLAETEAELSFCRPRRAGVMLFELAKFIGKRVVLTSDMYLEKPLVEKILKKCGVEGYDKLYLSSEYKKLKSTGALFKVVRRTEGGARKEILHIGDNWAADILAAEKEKIRPLFFPKAVETYTNNISNIYTGDAFKQVYDGAHANYDSRCVMKQLPLRCLYACAACGFFDDPFRSFHEGSLYNADAYYMGFSAMGMHLLGLAKFVKDKAEMLGLDHIVFLARDGYMVKQVFDILYGGSGIRSSYFYANRKILLPFAIKKKEDLFGLYQYFDLTVTCPKDVLKILEPVCGKLTAEHAVSFHKCGISLHVPFHNRSGYFDFARAAYKIMGEDLFDAEKLQSLRSAISAEFDGRCGCFDIGYSGRLQAILCDITGKRIDVFYVHDNGSASRKVAKKHGFEIYNFYEFTPNITSVLREYLISEPETACCGYKIIDGKLVFQFDSEKQSDYSETYAVREMQRGAIDYCLYVKEMFGDRLKEFMVRPQDISVAFENFLWNAEEFDRRAFCNSYLEDEVYGGYSKKSFYEIWNWHLQILKKNPVIEKGNTIREINSKDKYPFLTDKPLFVKGLFYWLFDRDTFREKYQKRKAIKKLKRGD